MLYVDLQRLLEAGGLPFVGTGADAAGRAFDKVSLQLFSTSFDRASLPEIVVMY